MQGFGLWRIDCGKYESSSKRGGAWGYEIEKSSSGEVVQINLESKKKKKCKDENVKM